MSTDQQTGPTFAPGFDPTQSEAANATVTETGAPVDYFGFAKTEKFMFPDGVSFIEFRAMNEGEKKKYQDKTSQDLILERNSGNARMNVKAGTERWELIKACVVSWNLTRNGEPLPTDLRENKGMRQFDDFLLFADPRIIEDLEKAIRKANPWLLAEMKPEDIEKQIEDLQEMLVVARKREAGEGS